MGEDADSDLGGCCAPDVMIAAAPIDANVHVLLLRALSLDAWSHVISSVEV